MKQNNKIAKCSILNCRSIRLWDQIAWLKNQKQLLKLSMDGCMCGIVELKSLKKQLPSKCVLDLVQCEESGCTNVCGDTTCHCTGNDDDVFHLQNGVGNNNKKLCSEHMKTFQCSNCCVYFCGVQDNNGVFPVGCKECGKLCGDHSLVRAHVRLVHSPRIVKCTENMCHKSFKSKEGLKQHLLVHSGVKNFICSECGYAVRTKHHLKLHVLKRHTAMKKTIPCEVCGKLFRHISNLKCHFYTHKARLERPHRCEVCRRHLQAVAIRLE